MVACRVGPGIAGGIVVEHRTCKARSNPVIRDKSSQTRASKARQGNKEPYSDAAAGAFRGTQTGLDGRGGRGWRGQDCLHPVHGPMDPFRRRLRPGANWDVVEVESGRVCTLQARPAGPPDRPHQFALAADRWRRRSRRRTPQGLSDAEKEAEEAEVGSAAGQAGSQGLPSPSWTPQATLS